MKAPAFQFYAGDYLADAQVMMMTLEQEGAYIRLLAICWREGVLPADLKSLSMLCKGASPSVLRVVTKCFQPNPNQPGTLIHKRLTAEIEKQAEWRAKSAAGGKKSAEKRWGDKGGSKGGANQSVTLQSSPSITSDDVTPPPPETLKVAKPTPLPVRRPPLDEDEATCRFADSAFNTNAWAVWLLEIRKVPEYAGVDFEHYRQQIRLADLGVNEQLPNRSWKKKLLNWLKNDLTATGGPRLVLATSGVDLSQPTPKHLLPPLGSDCTGRHIVLPNTGDANMNRMFAANYQRDFPGAIIHQTRA